MGLREFFKKYPEFYYFIASVFGPMWWSGINARIFLNRFDRSGRVLNLGSGPRRLGRNVVNVDRSSYPGVDVVADITHLPMPDNSHDGAILDTVLEHVKEPEKVVKEVYRVLKPEGYLYITIPFLYPFHSSPSDYRRWTEQGFRDLVRDFEVVESGVRAGPFSALTVLFVYIFALIFSFGAKKVFWVLVDLGIFVFFPIKFLDILFSRFKASENLAAVLYFVLKKK